MKVPQADVHNVFVSVLLFVAVHLPSHSSAATVSLEPNTDAAMGNPQVRQPTEKAFLFGVRLYQKRNGL